MRSRLVMLLAFAIAAAAIAFSVTRVASSAPSRPPVVIAPIPPVKGSFLGVFEAGSPPSYQPITAFASAAGRRPNLVGYYSGWAEKFAASFAENAYHHEAHLFVQIDPTFASVSGIASGFYDGYLRSYADSVRNFRHPVVIGFGHEMNAPWYSWGFGHVQAPVFIAAWRHIVTLFRSQGADNVTWLWTINADRPGTGPIERWWPGGKYVTWVGIDGYYYRPHDTFATVFGTTIHQVRVFTHKPVLLSETAVGPATNQFEKIGDLFKGMLKYKTLGLVWFDKVQHDGIYHQNWRIEDNTAATNAFQAGVSSALKPASPSP